MNLNYPVKKIIFPRADKSNYLVVLLEKTVVANELALSLCSIIKSVTGQIPSTLRSIKKEAGDKTVFYIGPKDRIDIINKNKDNIFFILTNNARVPLKKASFSDDDQLVNFFFGKDNHISSPLIYSYYTELMNHFYGETNTETIFLCLKFFRLILKIKNKGKSKTIFTIDSEDQHNYFNNKNNRCTDITGSKENLDDMRFDKSVLKASDLLLRYNIHPTFMVTASDLRRDSKDGFGNRISHPERNIQILTKFAQNNKIAIACHAYDHNLWLKYGFAGEKPMNAFSKMKYFIISGGGFTVFLKYIYATLKLGKRKRDCLGSRGEFTSRTLDYSILKLEKLFKNNKIKFTKLFRGPGFRRTALSDAFLEDKGYCDSSDTITLNGSPLPPVPYYLFRMESGKLSLSKMREFPCLFIDRFFRTDSNQDIKLLTEYFEAIYSHRETVLTIITHTKVIGGNEKHIHIYPRNPLSGLSQPAKRNNLNKILLRISKLSDCPNIREFIQNERERNC